MSGAGAIRLFRYGMLRFTQPIEFNDPFEMGSRSRRHKSTPPGQTMNKVGRNQPCPCGSGKKFKLCHGAASAVAPQIDLKGVMDELRATQSGKSSSKDSDDLSFRRWSVTNAL
jgi:SEC-C motif